MTGAAPSNSNSSRAFDRSQLRTFSTLPSSAASLGRRGQRVGRQRGWGLKTDMERGESEGAESRDRGPRETWIVRRREHRKSDGVVDGERWRGTCRTIVPCHSHPPLGPAHVLHTALLLGSLATGLAGVKRGRCLMAGHQPQLIPVLLEPPEVLGPGSLCLLLWEVASFLMSRSGGSGWCYLFQT